MGQWLAKLSIQELGPSYVPFLSLLFFSSFFSVVTHLITPFLDSKLTELALQIPLPQASLPAIVIRFNENRRAHLENRMRPAICSVQSLARR